MKRKSFIVLLSFVGCCLSFFFFNAVGDMQINAATNNSGSVTKGIMARINIAPLGISSSGTTGFKTGDKIALQAENANANNSWLLLNKETYTDYMMSYSESCYIDRDQIASVPSCSHSSITGWLARTSLGISDYVTFLNTTGTGTWSQLTDGKTYYGTALGSNTGIDKYYIDYYKTSNYTYLSNFENELQKTKDYELLTYRNLTRIHKLLNDPKKWVDPQDTGRGLLIFSSSYDFVKQYGKVVFADDASVYFNDGPSFNLKYLPYASDTWYSVAEGTVSNNGKSIMISNSSSGTGTAENSGAESHASTNFSASDPFFTHTAQVRATTYLDLSKVVFSLSEPGSASKNALVTISKDCSKSKRIYKDAADNQPMIARILDTNMKVTLSKLNKYGTNEMLTKKDNTYLINKNGKLDLSVTGNSVNGSVISAMLFDKASGEFKYYFQNIGQIDSLAGKLTVDLQDIPIGEYQIAVVNEMIPTNNAPVYSSNISSVLDLTIVEPLSITFTQSKASFTYGDVNTLVNKVIGYVTPSNGIAPYQYEIVQTNENTTGHEYFKLNVFDQPNGTREVIVDGNKSSKGLNAGEYKFTIRALDSTGNPINSDGNSTATVDVTITVNKAKPTIEYLQPDDMYISYQANYGFIDQVKITNGQSPYQVTYTTSNDIVTTSNIFNYHSYVKLNPLGTTGQVIVTATLQGDDNHEPATASKKYQVYKGLQNFMFTPSKLPTTTADTMTSDYVVGRLSVSDGIAKYTYSIEADPNGTPEEHANASSFKLDTTPTANQFMDVKVTSQLTAGTYRVTFKVEDQYHQVLYLPVTITIAEAEQTGFEFYDYETMKIITNQTKQLSLHTQGAKVFASGGEGNGAVTYRIKDGEDSSILDVDHKSGALTLNKIGNVKVQAVKAADGNYESTTIEMTIEVTKIPQVVKFDSAIPEALKFNIDEVMTLPAILKRDDATIGDITYQSMTPEICSISSTENGNVIMKSEGECIIKVYNDDENYTYTEDTISIILYDGMNASFVQVIDPLHQGDEALDVQNQTVIAKVTKLIGNQGTPTYNMKVSKNNVDQSTLFNINEQGEITVKDNVGYGTYDVEITIVDESKQEKVILGEIIVGLEHNDLQLTYQNTPTVKIEEDYANVKNGFSVNVIGALGSKQIHYMLSSDSKKDPEKDTEAITVNDDGTIIVHRAMTQQDQYKVYAYIEEDQINGLARQESNEVPIVINNSEMKDLSWLMDGSEITMIQDTYEYKKEHQLGIKHVPDASTITYELVMDENGKSNQITVNDVVQVDKKTGKLTILHANKTEQIGQVFIKATITCEGYEAYEMEPVLVQIDQAEQDFRFSQSIYLVSEGTGTLTPIFVGDILDKEEQMITLDFDGAFDISILNDSYHYNIHEHSTVDVPLKATHHGNRDYKEANATAILKILGSDTELIDVEVSPSRVITYGEKVTVSVDEEDGETYSYLAQNQMILKQNHENEVEFEGIHVGTTEILVTKSVPGKEDSFGLASIKVVPKEVNVSLTACPVMIYTGEAIPDFQVHDFEEGAILYDDVIPEPNIHVDITNTNVAGTYPINIEYPITKVSENYKFITKECNLIIQEIIPQESWFKVYKKGDIDQAEVDLSKWYNEPLIIESIHPEYSEISLIPSGNWNSTIEVNQEGEIPVRVYFRNNQTQAITEPIDIILKLDMTKPIIKNIEANETKQSILPRMVNSLSFGTAYRPGVRVDIQAEDVLLVNKNSDIKDISYEISTIKDSLVDQQIQMDTAYSNEVSITLTSSGNYRVCATPSDYAGNNGKTECENITVKNGQDSELPDPDKENPDHDQSGKDDTNQGSDDDQNSDDNQNQNQIDKNPNNPNQCPNEKELNVDTDGDHKPDLNIDINGDCIVDFNIDLDSESSIPDVNIDTNLDGKADYNIDRNDDGVPDVNIGPSLMAWKPNQCTKEGFIYCTMTDLRPEINIDTNDDGIPDINIDLDHDGKPDINVDTDGDLIPDIDIDVDGDGIPDINIDFNKDGLPDQNIVDITEWKPNIKGNKDGIEFGTMEMPMPVSDSNGKKQSSNSTESFINNHKKNTESNSDDARNHIGGAITYDKSNVVLYMVLGLSSFIFICFTVKKSFGKKG